MALDEISQLYNEIVDSDFRLMPSGQFHINVIYTKVKGKYSHLCDESYLCADNCGSGHNQPEWKHAVRRSLERLKTISTRVTKGPKYYWIFK
jgi:hypothetical protein